MKNPFNKIIVCISLLVGGLMPGGCSQDNQTDFVDQEVESMDQETKERLVLNEDKSSATATISPKESNEVLDSLNSINGQIVSMSQSISEQKTATTAIEKNITKIRRVSMPSILIAWGLGIISLIIAILAFIKAKASIFRLGKQRKEIEELKRLIAQQEARFMDGSRNFSSRLENRENSELTSRLNRIERKLKELIQSVPTQPSMERDSTVSPSSYDQSGYFDLPIKKSATEAYFKDWSKSRSPESRFKATIKGENAQFYLLEGTQYLNEIKSNDTIQMALDLQGCFRSEANQMRIMSPGEARLVGDRWEITKKVKIELSK